MNSGLEGKRRAAGRRKTIENAGKGGRRQEKPTQVWLAAKTTLKPLESKNENCNRLGSFEFPSHAIRKCAFGERARLSEHFGIEKGEKARNGRKNWATRGSGPGATEGGCLRRPEPGGNGLSRVRVCG